MELHFLLSCCQLLALLKQTVDWHLLDLHHVHVVSDRHDYLIAEPDVFVGVDYATWSEVAILLADVRSARANARTAVLVSLVLLHISAGLRRDVLCVLLAVHHVGDVVILRKHILLSLLERACHVAWIVLGPVVDAGLVGRVERGQINGDHCL